MPPWTRWGFLRPRRVSRLPPPALRWHAAALDVTIQAQAVELLLKLSQRQGMAMLHNLGVVAACFERVMTMYAGQIIEDAGVDGLLTRLLHPYS